MKSNNNESKASSLRIITLSSYERILIVLSAASADCKRQSYKQINM